MENLATDSSESIDGNFEFHGGIGKGVIFRGGVYLSLEETSKI